MSIKFSVITVCYNSESTIKETIQSIQDQTYKNYEHIIIDGNSNDSTMDIINEYRNNSEKVRVISETDTGIYNAMNKGARLAEGDLIVFLNSDDTFEKNALEIISQNYTDDMDLIYGKVFWLEKYKGKTFEKELAIDHEKKLKEKDMIPHNSTFVKTKIMKENLFDESLRICSDYKFFLEMHIQNRKIAFIPERITNMLMGGISTTQLELGIEEHLKCQNEVLGFSNIDINKRKKEIRLMTIKKKFFKSILPSCIYIRYRYLKNGWKLMENR